MDARFQEALNYVRTVTNETYDAARYLAECEYLVGHRDQVPGRVFINLPGGLSGNADPAWQKVKDGSEERCGCGNERTILPLNPREEFKASGEPVVVADKKGVYLKPVGGDKPTTHIHLWIEEGALAYLMDPFAPLVFSADMFSTKGFSLEKLAEALQGRTEPLELTVARKDQRTPICAISAADQAAQTATIILDADVEIYDPATDTAPAHKH